MDEIEKYIIAHSSRWESTEAEGLEWIRRQTHLRTNHARMLSGPVQGHLLRTLCGAFGARRALEIGTFTGYASACIALGLKDCSAMQQLHPDSPGLKDCSAMQQAHLDSLEINDELEDIIRQGWRRVGVEDVITLHLGDALETIARLSQSACPDKYDLVYIDANKRQYCAYYDAVLPLLRPGGVILADNTLWDGKVLEDPMPRDAQTVEISLFNGKVADDPRVEAIILPLRDGLTIIRKKAE